MTDDAIAIRREPLSFPCFHSHGDFDARAKLIEEKTRKGILSTLVFVTC